MPKHTVIIPSYNSAKTLEVTLKSVLCQTCEDLELIVVDDASTVPMSDVYSKFEYDRRVALVCNPLNSGPGYCRNLGIKAARGKYLHFLDSDDFWFPSYLEMIESFHRDTGSPLCCSSYVRIGQISDFKYFNSFVHPPARILGKDMFVANHIPILTSSIDSERLSIPLFEERPTFLPGSISRPEDYIFWLQLYESNPGLIAACMHFPLAVYRVMPDGRSANKFLTLVRQYEVKRRILRMPPFISLWYVLSYVCYSIRGKSLPELREHLLTNFRNVANR